MAAMKEGATDFLGQAGRPRSPSVAAGRARLERRTRFSPRTSSSRRSWRRSRGLPEIVGQDASLKQVVSTLRRAAESDATVLLGGESGTGKELFARALHVFSSRAEGPFVAINCAAIPETLLRVRAVRTREGSLYRAPSLASRASSRWPIAVRSFLTRSVTSHVPHYRPRSFSAIEERQL